MESFSSSLLEHTRHHLLSLDSEGQREKTVRDKAGILQRRYDGNWQSRAIEISPLDDRLSGLPAAPDSERSENALACLQHELLQNTLAGLDLTFWRISIRGRESRRAIVNRHSDALRNLFQHYSIMVQFRSSPQGQLLEVAEGNIEGYKFNIDGLCARLQELATHHRQARHMEFYDPIPVILSPGDGAILFHEILGHSLETDYIYQGHSPFSLKDLHTPVMSTGATVLTEDYRDPFFRSYQSDDEGEKADSAVVIENGVIRNFISDFFHSRLLHLNGCGHCRVEDFSRLPMPRMFGLYLTAGPHDPEEILRNTSFGVLAREFGNGRVYFHRHTFSCQIHQAFLVEHGRITAPLGTITIGGPIRDVLAGVTQIGNDFRYDRGVSYCNKNGQVILVRVGQPTVRLENLQVWASHA
jgi:predicted Zn-dependent protease